MASTTEAGFTREVWPELKQSAWGATCETLQLWAQVVGKVRLALTPALNHTWNVTLYPTVRGLLRRHRCGTEHASCRSISTLSSMS